jgi:outer membrane putative beta-barrel porin/alpha-amylase
MKRLSLALLALPLVLATNPVCAQDGLQNVSFFYPLRTRRPVIERELEVRVEHAKGRDGRTTEAAAALELPILPRWQVEIEVPLVFQDPKDGEAQGGVGDLSVENKVMVWQSLDWLSQIAVGVEVRLPTGSERRGLGGEAAIEPFVSGGIALGDFDVLAAVVYEFNVNAHVPGPNEQELTASAAVGWRVSPWFTPLLELVTVTRTRGAPDEELLHRTRVSLVPGFNARLLPRSTLRFGVELPLTRARAADYTLLGGFVKEF